ncbi:flagellar assembly protein FliH [Altererythrobacter atlanticus]|uniref:Flagellar assembly protein FliH n=1 Tax=Croceibacterium atlanticum TaxID=1267766 RepID=A0A0F7KWW5_9SPHN|nr:FliH/SctL family protein [Croceibacterium atlanticum]AKH44164.1 flagellar assembly protein H [Croceibacterium atlanticum]MBB5732475.1 flagellar assembly protein FliH [Croceibacterium atlanticum]
MSRPALQDMFKPRSFTQDPRFAGFAGSPPPPCPADPVGEAFERGYAQGMDDTRAEIARQQAASETALRKIELAFTRLDEETAAELREKFRQTVLALCNEAIAPLAVDEEGLTRRIERAVSMLQRSQDEKRVLLNPEDLALVADRLPSGLTVEADPAIERGALRIETPDGGIEDGPSQWRRILDEAFREC